MRIDAGLIIGVALEFIIMLYFANSTLQPKKNYYISSAMCFVGYLIVFAFSLFNQLFVNVGVFIVINLLIFNLGYRINFKTSIFQTIMLLVFMFLGEIIVAFTMKIHLIFMKATEKIRCYKTMGEGCWYEKGVYQYGRKREGVELL